jgi:hypothetical protein
MKNLKLILAFIFATAIAQQMKAQGEFSSFTITGHGLGTVFASDYQCLGINPANTAVKYNEKSKRFAFGLLEGAFSLNSGVLTKKELVQNIFQSGFGSINRDQQLMYAQQFAQQTNAMDLDVMLIGASMNLGKLGAIGFSMRDRMDMYSKMGPEVAELIWLGSTASMFSDLIIETANGNYDTIPNSPDINADTLAMVVQGISNLSNSSVNSILQGTKFNFSWIREFNFNYSRPIVETDDWSLYGGVGIKLLRGQAMMSIVAEDNITQAHAAFSPMFEIDTDSLSNPTDMNFTPKLSKMDPVGRGMAVDLGVTLKVKDTFFASAAVTDIGGMNWNTNVYEFSNDTLNTLAYNGMQDVNLVNNLSQLSLGSDMLKWNGVSSFHTKMPATMRAGAAIMILDVVKVGIDAVAPLNREVSNLQKGIITMGAEVKLPLNFRISGGVVKGGNYNTPRITAGLTKSSLNGVYEWGIASRDIITYFSKNEPTVSMAVGFLRFKI